MTFLIFYVKKSKNKISLYNKMSRSFKEDYEYGINKQKENLEKLREYFKDDIEPIEDIYSKSDFKGNNHYYEMKSRKITHDKYPTFMLSSDKIRENLIVVYCYLDGLFYIEYDEELFKEFYKEKFKRNDRIDKIDYEKDIYYIPIKYLKPIK